MIFALLKSLYLFSPMPIIAGIPCSKHLIDMWELAPPYFVIRPLIP